MVIGICDSKQRFTVWLSRKVLAYITENDISDCEIRTFTDSTALLDNIRDIDILFLDIELEESDSGLRIRDKIASYTEDIRIIFVTNHSEMMENAFGRNVYGFLQKKDVDSRLCRVMDSAFRGIAYDRLHLEDINGIVHDINLSQIEYIEVCDKYTDVYINKKDLVFRMSLKEWRHQLPVGRFYKASRFCIVNFEYLCGSVINWDLTIAGKPITVPKGRRKEFKNAYMLYMRDK